MRTLSDKCRLLLIDMSLITESESVSGPLAKSCLQVCGHHYYIIGAVLNQNTDNPFYKKAKVYKIGNGDKNKRHSYFTTRVKTAKLDDTG